MMNLIISFRKTEVRNLKPICISNGKSEIFTAKLTLTNISGDIEVNFGKKDRHGSLAPLIIPVLDETTFDVNLIQDSKVRRLMKERIRYRTKNPIQRGRRKEMIIC